MYTVPGDYKAWVHIEDKLDKRTKIKDNEQTREGKRATRWTVCTRHQCRVVRAGIIAQAPTVITPLAPCGLAFFTESVVSSMKQVILYVLPGLFVNISPSSATLATSFYTLSRYDFYGFAHSLLQVLTGTRKPCRSFDFTLRAVRKRVRIDDALAVKSRPWHGIRRPLSKCLLMRGFWC